MSNAGPTPRQAAATVPFATFDVNGPDGKAHRIIETTILDVSDPDEGGLAVTLDELAVYLTKALIEADLVHDPARILKLPASLSADDVTVLQWAAPVQQAGGGSLVVQVPPVLGGDGQQDTELTAMSALVALLDGLDPEAGRRVSLWAMDRWAGDVIDRG